MDLTDENNQPELVDSDQPTQLELRTLIGVVTAAVVVRLLLLVFRRDDLHTDPDAYVTLAETIKATGGFNSPGTNVPTAFRPPLYPMLLALLTFVGCKMSFAVGLLSALSGAITTAAAWWTARVLSLRGLWPLVAAAVVAVDPLLLRYSTLPMTETLSAALLASGTLLLLHAVNENEQGETLSVRRLIESGIAFSLAGYCRPICFAACGLMTIGIALRMRSAGVKQILTSFIPVACCIVALTPWGIRNAIQFNAFVPLTTHGGYTLLLGNNGVFYRDVVQSAGQPVWANDSFRNWEDSIKRSLEDDGVSGEIATDRWMMNRARAAISANHTAFIKSCLLRWQRFWGIRPEVEGKSGSRSVVWAVGTWYCLLWVGLAGSLMLIRQQPRIGILWLAILAFFIVHTFYWTNARMRAPLTAVIVVLSIYGWRPLLERASFFRRLAQGKQS